MQRAKVTPPHFHRVKRGLDRVVHGSPCDESRGGAPKGERARKRMVRASGSSVARAAPAAFADGNIRECGAAVDDAPSGAPPPFFVEARFVNSFGKTRGANRKRSARTGLSFFRPRDSGGGGPREAWWRGLLTRRCTFVEGEFDEACAPSTIRSLRARMVPLPRYRGGRMKEQKVPRQRSPFSIPRKDRE
jgi:hypothetical protein